jgi:hypothetical protein
MLEPGQHFLDIFYIRRQILDRFKDIQNEIESIVNIANNGRHVVLVVTHVRSMAEYPAFLQKFMAIFNNYLRFGYLADEKEDAGTEVN